MRDVRDVLDKEIQRRGFKQSAIAHMAGLKKQQLSDILNKRRKLGADELFALCDAIGISPNEIYESVRDD